MVETRWPNELSFKRKFYNGLFFNTAKNHTYSRSSKVLPDLNFLKIFNCQHIASVEIQPMFPTASTNIFNTFMHTLVSVNMTHLSRKGSFLILIFHHHVIPWKLPGGYHKGVSTISPIKHHYALAGTLFSQEEWHPGWRQLYKPHAVLIKFITNAVSLSRFEGR